MQRAQIEVAPRQNAPLEASSSNDNESLRDHASRLKREKKFEEAAHVWRQIIHDDPKDAVAMNELGSALASMGRVEEGLQWFRRALEVQPDHRAAKINIAVALRSLGRFDEALSSLRNAVNSNADDAAACFNLGVTLKCLQQYDEALTWLRRAFALQPAQQENAQEIAEVLQAQKRSDDAIEAYRSALALRPDCAETMMRLGSLLQEMRQFQEAATIFRRVVTLDPSHCDGWLALGAALLGAKRQGESVAAFRRAIALQPGSPVAYCNMSLALMDLDRIEEGIDACRKAIFIEPGSAVATFNLGCMLLAQGNFREGWEAYDYRFALGTEKWLREEARAAPWTGESLKDKSILILGEQGNGDHLQFCRYLAKLSDLGATVSYLAPTRLHRLFGTLRGSVKLLSEIPDNSRFDFQCPLMHLPGLFNRLGYPIPTDAPYLAAEPERVAHWRTHIGDHGFRIGIVWQGNNYNGDDLRSHPLDSLLHVAKIPGVRLISLQIKDGTEQLNTLPQGMKVETLPDFDIGEDGFIDSAAVLEVVDLVITCDTSMVHLAGALGRPVWVALNEAPEWRWQRNRSDSIWYPTARLFRQQAKGDWDRVFLDMAEALAHLIQRPSNDPPSEARDVSTSPEIHVSWGEFLDKLSILEIKADRIKQEAALANVMRELAHLNSILAGLTPLSTDARREHAALRTINEALWDLEDAVRSCEANQRFDARFVELARKIYAFNDNRARTKKRINALMNSSLVEEKEHNVKLA